MDLLIQNHTLKYKAYDHDDAKHYLMIVPAPIFSSSSSS